MLEDDVLDFDDFGDLGELEGAPEMSTEELEKQLALEFGEESQKEDLQPKKDTVIDFDEDLDEGEIVETEEEKKKQQEVKNDTAKSETTSNKSSLNSNAPAFKPRYNSNNNSNNNSKSHNGYQNNFYGQPQQSFTPDMMAMNMYNPYPQFSNRIYVNPKFNSNAATINQQQMMQQRQYMEQRQALLLHQQQMLQNHEKRKELELLDEKRRQTAEALKKRREAHNQSKSNASSAVGEKRKHSGDDNNPDDYQSRRQEALNRSPSKGLSIKGAAAAAQAASQSSPNNSSGFRSTISSHAAQSMTRGRVGEQRPSIVSRLNMNNQAQQKKPISTPTIAPSAPTTVIPILTGGKSNALIIKDFKDDVKEEDIKKMTDKVPGTTLKFDVDAKTATVMFPTVEAAVTFRRQYNRVQLGDSHINIVFKK